MTRSRGLCSSRAGTSRRRWAGCLRAMAATLALPYCPKGLSRSRMFIRDLPGGIAKLRRPRLPQRLQLQGGLELGDHLLARVLGSAQLDPFRVGVAVRIVDAIMSQPRFCADAFG